MAHIFQLLIAIPDKEPVAFQINGDLIRVGRAPDNDIQLLIKEVSTKHAEFHKTYDSYEISDIGSTNGTKVNDETVQGRVKLGDRDSILLGDTIPAYFLVLNEGEVIDPAAVIAEIEAEPSAPEAVAASLPPKAEPMLPPPGGPPAAKKAAAKKAAAKKAAAKKAAAKKAARGH